MRKEVKIAVITLGKLGAYVRTYDGGQIVKAFRNKALDATGAGDAFWGGFLYQFCRCGKLPEEVSVSEAASFFYLLFYIARNRFNPIFYNMNLSTECKSLCFDTFYEN
ncbi:carbohydrate kinase family protein [Ruminococcus bicirculans (ex Wegman et al. 2014)]|uniref:carbohydrate kinase family protein n=1 Tax=Ruminococcus bicirculans (ex Wegman et al. 2014) TaxID=1160721 RepID=UPI003FD74C4C